ncbi:MAG: hypothetical protein H6Q84_3661 [Deltaproteobacteria bacterium]|nr:hypothetical protein [Deltaproteobacteria bacterium]
MACGVASRTPSWKASISPRRTESGVRQLVGDVGDPLPARRLVLLERQRQRVEIARELAQFVGGIPGNARVEPARSQQVRGRGQVADPADHLPRQRHGEKRRQGDHGQGDEGEGLFLFLDEPLLPRVGNEPRGQHPEVAHRLPVVRERPQGHAAGQRRGTEDGVLRLVEQHDPSEESPARVLRGPGGPVMHRPHSPSPRVPHPLRRGALRRRSLLPRRPRAGNSPGPVREGVPQQAAQALRVVPQKFPGPFRGIRLLEFPGDGFQPLQVERMGVFQETAVEAPPHHQVHAEDHGARGGEHGEEQLVLYPYLHSSQIPQEARGKPPASLLPPSFPLFLHISSIFACYSCT